MNFLCGRVTKKCTPWCAFPPKMALSSRRACHPGGPVIPEGLCHRAGPGYLMARSTGGGLCRPGDGLCQPGGPVLPTRWAYADQVMGYVNQVGLSSRRACADQAGGPGYPNPNHRGIIHPAQIIRLMGLFLSDPTRSARSQMNRSWSGRSLRSGWPLAIPGISHIASRVSMN